MNIAYICNAVLGAAVFLSTTFAGAMTPEEIISALKRAENSTGNIADAVEEATGARGWMSSDMKPIYDTKIVGRAATALMRPVLRTDERKYRNYLLEILDEENPRAGVTIWTSKVAWWDHLHGYYNSSLSQYSTYEHNWWVKNA